MTNFAYQALSITANLMPLAPGTPGSGPDNVGGVLSYSLAMFGTVMWFIWTIIFPCVVGWMGWILITGLIRSKKKDNDSMSQGNSSPKPAWKIFLGESSGWVLWLLGLGIIFSIATPAFMGEIRSNGPINGFPYFSFSFFIPNV